jgi:hypothetical protein
MLVISPGAGREPRRHARRATRWRPRSTGGRAKRQRPECFVVAVGEQLADGQRLGVGGGEV